MSYRVQTSKKSQALRGGTRDGGVRSGPEQRRDCGRTEWRSGSSLSAAVWRGWRRRRRWPAQRLDVTVLESRNRLGGRAGSFTDASHRPAHRRLPARQHGLLHQPRPLLPDGRHRSTCSQPQPCSVFHDARSPRQPFRPTRCPRRCTWLAASCAPITSARWRSCASPGAWPVCSARPPTPIRRSWTGCNAIARRRGTIERFWGWCWSAP